MTFATGHLIALRTADDARVYKIEEIDGFYVKLSYYLGDKTVFTETDVCRLRVPTKIQLKNNGY